MHTARSDVVRPSECCPVFPALAAFRPDAVVTTHFIPANLAAVYQERRQHALRLFVTLTDYEVHPFWLVPPGRSKATAWPTSK